MGTIVHEIQDITDDFKGFIDIEDKNYFDKAAEKPDEEQKLESKY